MDSYIEIHNNDSTKKFLNEQRVVNVNDIISYLHESIIGQILSFLPTMEAVHTSVLSSKWIDVWKNTTSLCFNDSLLCQGKMMQREQFVHFVNNVLLHIANSGIQSFSLCLTRYQYDSSQVSSWISFALARGVQNLHIQYADKIFLSSHSLFSCSSLVQLVLQMRCILSVPTFSCLPNLQNLSISGIEFVSDDSSTQSKDLVLSFPVLKVFEARSCGWCTKQNVSIEAPLLERFSIAVWKSISNESCKSAIKISAPRLTDFCYEGDLEQDIILLNPSSIRSASLVIVIDESRKDRMENFWFQVHMLLKQLHHVERLKLLFYKVLINSKDVVFPHLPAFERLTYLQLNEVTGEALLNLLHNSPLLNTVVLLNGVSDLNNDVLAFTTVPHCFLHSLKVFQYKGFNVHEHELCLAKLVMANAAILERMTITAAFWLRYSDIDIEKVKEKIFSYPKCSIFAEMEFNS